jgi:CRP-like cAMP-binding protein
MQRTYQLSDIAPTRAEGEMAALLRREGRRLHFAAHAFVQQQGDAPDGFWLVESGSVSVCRFGIDGGVTIFAVLGPGDLFGELAHFTRVARQVDVVAETPATMVRVDGAAIDRLLAQQPDFARLLLRSLGNQLRVAIDRIEGNRHLSAEARVARILVDLVRRGGPELLTTHDELGNLVGLSRVSIGQILARFAAAGLVALGYRRILVTDVAALARRASVSAPSPQ